MQWGLVTACLLVTALLAGATWHSRVMTRRLEDLEARHRDARVERGAIDAQLTRERASREAFSLELDRLRAGQVSAGGRTPAALPTLTLEPPASRAALPPAPTVVAPAPQQAIELRLLMPAGVVLQNRVLEVVSRDWSSGRTRWSRADAASGVVDGRRAVIVHVTGEMVAPGTYELTVAAIPAGGGPPEVIASYELGVGPRS